MPAGVTGGAATDTGGHMQQARALVVVLAAGLLAVLGPGATSPALASKTISTRYLLGHLGSAGEHSAGYDRGKFALWADADGDGCDTREEVLIAEARVRPKVLAGCRLTGGRWFSTYDATVTTHPSGFDIDHLVPLNEAWQSGAYRWSAGTRKAYANDLGYPASLLAVSARANRSKSDHDPREWMPPRTSYSCHYVADWVAVKWRWHLSVNATERAFLDQRLRACGWPRVATPSRPRIVTGAAAGGEVSAGGGSTAGTTGATGSASGTTVDAPVHPGAFCAEHRSYGYTSAGTLMRCMTTATDARFRWRSA